MERNLVCQKSVSGKSWFLRETSGGIEIAQKLGEHEIVGKLLAGRGISLADAPRFLDPKLRDFMLDPSHLKDLDRGVGRLSKAIKNHELVAIFGDYDADGISSSALLHSFFREIRCSPQLHIPNRFQEGYGPSFKVLEKFKLSGASVVIMVDCGTTAFSVLEEGSKLGLDIIIIDHHKAEKELPNAYAVINPNRTDEDSPLKTLSSVGLCFMVLVALTRALRRDKFFEEVGLNEPHLMSLLDLVALGTICDVVSLRDLNRAFVAQGLKIIAKQERVGFRALIESAKIKECIDAYHLGFILGPRINAGGRVGRSDLGINLLTTDSLHAAKAIAKEINLYNQKRQGIECSVLSQAFEQIGNSLEQSIFVWSDNWHPGVLGIVAGRLRDCYNCPSIVVSLNRGSIGVGSGRSVPGTDLGKLVQTATKNGLVESGGGHTKAVGFSVKREKLQDLRKFFNENIVRVDSDNVLFVDDFLDVESVTSDFIRVTNRLAPYGEGNPSPCFVVKNLVPKEVQCTRNGHIDCSFVCRSNGSQEVRAFAFRASGSQVGKFLLSKEKPLALVGSLRKRDSYSNNRHEHIFLTIEDAAPMSSILS